MTFKGYACLYPPALKVLFRPTSSPLSAASSLFRCFEDILTSSSGWDVAVCCMPCRSPSNAFEQPSSHEPLALFHTPAGPLHTSMKAPSKQERKEAMSDSILR
eukprot:1154724-Pelagomonas_calceolata.AAC.2